MANPETIKMIIRFYNMQAGTSIRAEATTNQRIVEECLNRVEDVVVVKNHIRAWVQAHRSEDEPLNGRLEECLDAIEIKKEVPQTTAPNPQNLASSLSLIEQTVANIIAQTQADSIREQIMGSVKQTISDYIKQEYGAIERKITTVIDGEKKDIGGVQHEKFETVVKFVRNNEPVFLTGPAGSGKNELCKQVAKALDLDFYFTNAVTQEYKLTGFTDANGRYQETQFYKAFTKGGLFMLDEMDASIPEVLVILNAAIANGYFDFPAPIGYVEANPNFRVIAAGNTLGHGADFEYVGRNQLDGASLDRFAVVRIDYSKVIEDAMANGDIELADFCREYRKIATESGIAIIVSYRAIKRLAKMVQILSLTEALDTCLTKGMGKDDLNIITSKLSNGKYKNAMMELARVA